MKKCPDCGASIPEEASFCPVCASSINQRREPEPPGRYLSRKTMWIAAILLLAALMGAGIYAFNRPKVYEGAGEVFYSDSEGSYQLLTNYTLDRHEPMELLDTAAGAEERYRFPSYLYINYADSGIDATDIFMEKVNSELLALTYGSLVVQLLRDLGSADAVNAQLDRMGYNIGIRIVEE